MQRKLVKQGNSALTVTLPSKWIANQGLKAGDVVEVEEKGKEITITSGSSKQYKSIKLELSDDPNLAKRQLGYAYKRGVDQIEATFRNLDLSKRIHEFLSMYLGYEIIDHGKAYCVIKNIASPNEEDLDNVLNRTFLITLELAEETYAKLSSGNIAQAGDLIYLEKLNNRLTYFCKRILNKKGYKEHFKTTVLYRAVVHLEQVADQYKEIIYYLQYHSTKKISSASLKEFKELNTHLRSLYQVSLSRKAGDIQSLLQKSKDLQLRLRKAKFSNADDMMICIHLRFLVDLITDLAGTYYELSL